MNWDHRHPDDVDRGQHSVSEDKLREMGLRLRGSTGAKGNAEDVHKVNGPWSNRLHGYQKRESTPYDVHG